MTIAEVAKITGKSEQSVRRAIKARKLKATLIDGHYEIEEKDINEWVDYRSDNQSDSQPIDTDSQPIVVENEALKRKITELEARIVEKDKSLEEARKASEESQQRHDTVVMQLSRQYEQSLKMLESSEMKQEQRRSWWSRLWKQKDDT